MLYIEEPTLPETGIGDGDMPDAASIVLVLPLGRKMLEPALKQNVRRVVSRVTSGSSRPLFSQCERQRKTLGTVRAPMFV